MDSIEFDAFSETSDTFNYFLKETIETTFVDNAGNTAYKIEVAHRFDSSMEWKFSRYISANSDIYSGFRTEYDLRKVKLIFPLKNRKTWDENQFNSLDKQLNKYYDIDESKSIGNLEYEQTLRVDKGDEEDPFFRFFGEEIYAKGIGLIQEKYINTETQKGKIDGIKYTKTLYKTNW